jgi:hypothetical protein
VSNCLFHSIQTSALIWSVVVAVWLLSTEH